MRHFILVLLPCLAVSSVVLVARRADAKVWLWVAVPFPVMDPYADDPFPDVPWPKKPHDNGTDTGDEPALPPDINFAVFLVWYVLQDSGASTANDRYFGYVRRFSPPFDMTLMSRIYLAVALFFITNLFSLYRLSEHAILLLLEEKTNA